MTNMDPVMEPIFTKTIPCPGVGILKMIPCSAARPRTEKYMSTLPPGAYHRVQTLLNSLNFISSTRIICVAVRRQYMLEFSIRLIALHLLEAC